MLSTLLAQAPWMPIAAIGLFAIVSPLIGRWLLPHRHTTRVLFAIALITILGLTLYPEPRGLTAIQCSAQWPYLHPFAVETMANIALFIPVAFLATILTRRPLLVALAGGALSATIEMTQGLVPSIGRACDTGDLLTNTFGAVVGAALAFASLFWHRRALRSTSADPCGRSATTTRIGG